MYQCSRAGASLNLKVRNRSKMRTNHPVVWYIAFIWYRLNVPKVNNACFTNTIFFSKRNTCWYCVPWRKWCRFSLCYNFRNFLNMCVRKEVATTSLHLRSLVDIAVHRWTYCVSIFLLFTLLYSIERPTWTKISIVISRKFPVSYCPKLLFPSTIYSIICLILLVKWKNNVFKLNFIFLH